MGSTAKGVPYPDLTDAANGPDGIKGVADFVDAVPGISVLTYTQINAISGFSLWTGRCVYQKDAGTDRPVAGPYWYDGVDWRPPWNQPWGFIDEVTPVDFSTTSSSFVGVGASITFEAITNRIYEVHAEITEAQSTAADDIGELSLFDVDGQQRTIRLDAIQASRLVNGGSMEICKTYPAGSQTVQLEGRRVLGSGTFTFSGLLLKVKDVGTRGAPA